MIDVLVAGSEEDLKICEGNYKLSWLYCNIMLVFGKRLGFIVT